MGKFATYRKRGGGFAPASLLAAPPAPGWDLELGNYYIIPGGADNTGGRVEVEYSTDDEDFAPWADYAWNAAQNLSGLGEVLAGYYRTRSVGNGVAYIGTGPWSEHQYIEEM